MKIIDINTWKRKKHYEFFKNYEFPYFNICVNLDISKTYEFCKRNNLQFFRTTLYFVMLTVNEFEPLKLRIRGNNVILHDLVHPGITVIGDDELYGNCIIEFEENFLTYLESAEKSISAALKNIELDVNKESRDDLIYISCIKWLTFTSVEHPIRTKEPDSIPRIAWGKIFEENGKLKMPLSLMAHHSLLDGFQASEYYRLLQIHFNNPEIVFKSM